MFTSTGLFSKIACPKGHGCDLVNCIFSHELEGTNVHSDSDKKAYDPSTLVTTVSRPVKRRRIGSSENLQYVAADLLEGDRQETNHFVSTSRLQSTPVQPHKGKKGQEKTPISASDFKYDSIRLSSEKDHLKSITRSTTRPISPPPVARRTKQILQVPTLPPVKQEALVPRQVSKPPAQYKAREAALRLLHHAMSTLNDQLKGTDVKPGALVLSMDELTRMALEEEQQIALTCAENIYQQTIGRRIRGLQKMPPGEWKDIVIKQYKKALFPSKAEIPDVPQESILDTGLSVQQEIMILRELRTPLEGLEEYGYVTQPPTDAELTEVGRVIKDSAGWELCDRCGSRFRVIPGRDEEGSLTTNGRCVYHWGRILRPLRQRTDAITGQQEAHYACCGQGQGTAGCTLGESHVFKVNDPRRLAIVLQFERTPRTSSKKQKPPVTFDCEMAYTSLGLELIRLTAVSWPQGQILLDILVRPFGEILDLNTRFSGISKDHFANAIPYDPEKDDDEAVTNNNVNKSTTLRRVSSPAVARDLLFRHLTTDTPLLGHAIENDLNVCRIIHPFIIDTVLLYSHPRGLPARYSLKVLAGKYLGRSIQQPGVQGHDSKEDAEATGDLVRVKVAEKWKEMRLAGWRFMEEVLVPPDK